MKRERYETVTNCRQLKMQAQDGKQRMTNIAERWGTIAKEARLKLEAETGQPVVSPLNAKRISILNTNEDKENKLK